VGSQQQIAAALFQVVLELSYWIELLILIGLYKEFARI
jgi:hypothetical protein